MNKLLSKIVYAFMLILASNQISKIYCMEENQGPESVYDALSEEDSYTYISDKARIARLIKLENDLRGLVREYETPTITISAHHPEKKPTADRKKINSKIQRNRVPSKTAWTSIGITAGLFLSQIALGLKPQLIDIVPNFFAGLSIGYSTNIKNSPVRPTITALSTGLWIAYTAWRSYNTYDHWLRSLITK